MGTEILLTSRVETCIPEACESRQGKDFNFRIRTEYKRLMLIEFKSVWHCVL